MAWARASVAVAPGMIATRAGFIDRVVGRMPNHRHATKLECRKEEKEQQWRDDRELDHRGTGSLSSEALSSDTSSTGESALR